MPRPQKKTRLQLLALAEEQLQATQASLGLVDLRATSGELRECLRDARADVANSLAQVQRAIGLDATPQAR